MENEFLPVILGTDANAYGLARSFYDEYKVKSLALGVINLKETKKSKIIDTLIIPNLKNEDVFLNTLKDIKSKNKNKKLILLSCAEWYTELIVNNFEKLKNDYFLPFMDKDLKDKLENKDSFYNLCEKYNLDYPKTLVITKENKDNIKVPFSYPIALKPSSSSHYFNIDFDGKEKFYKINNYNELKETVNKIFNAGYEKNLIVQEFVPGSDDTMWVLNCYSDKNGIVKMMCLGRCILEEHTPYGIGNYKAIISDGNKEIYEKIKFFLEDINYVGFSNFDLKYDYRDKKFKLFEINIRQGRSSYFTTCAGNNLSKFIVDDIFNKESETVYNFNKHLWLAVPIPVLKKYVFNKKVLKEALNLIKEKKYSYTLKNPKDGSIYRKFWTFVMYFKDYKRFRKFPPGKE